MARFGNGQAGVLRTSRHVPALVVVVERRGAIALVYVQPVAPLGPSRFLGGGLRSGDPAALLDTRTGTLAWMAVSPLEEMQIGHYHQIKHAYDEAGGGTPPHVAASPALERLSILAQPQVRRRMGRRLFTPRGIAVFEFHCLTKLGRRRRAASRSSRFANVSAPASSGAHARAVARGSPRFPTRPTLASRSHAARRSGRTAPSGPVYRRGPAQPGRERRMRAITSARSSSRVTG